MAQRVVFYSESGSPPCDRVRAWLARHGIPFTERNIMIDVPARAHLAALGVAAPPVVVQGERVVVGDDLDALASLLAAR